MQERHRFFPPSKGPSCLRSLHSPGLHSFLLRHTPTRCFYTSSNSQVHFPIPATYNTVKTKDHNPDVPVLELILKIITSEHLTPTKQAHIVFRLLTKYTTFQSCSYVTVLLSTVIDQSPKLQSMPRFNLNTRRQQCQDHANPFSLARSPRATLQGTCFCSTGCLVAPEPRSFLYPDYVKP